jgi:hypothetical protein
LSFSKEKHPVPLSAFSELVNSPPEAFKQASLVLGLPRDTLSFTLIAFTRLFSLPMDAGLLAGLRREVLAAALSTPKSSGEKAKTAHALAAAAGAARGVSLSPGALEEYAAAISAGNLAGDDESGVLPRFSAGELRQFFEEFMEAEDGLLPCLNRIPFRDGRRWVVWPFKIPIGGVDLKVFIRILIRGEINSPALPGITAAVPDRLIADVAGPRRRWRFIFDKVALDEKGGEGLRAEIGVYPPPGRLELEALQKEAEGAFAGLGAEIRVLDGGEEFLPEIFFPAETLSSVDEEA